MKLILVTGAAGGVAEMIRPILRTHYRLRLSDRMPVMSLTSDETFVAADLGDIPALRRAIAGVDGIVHLGGVASERDWETIAAANISGTYNILEAARLEGVRRLIFASSNHVMGFYPRAQTIATELSVRPDSRYALSKAFGEAAGSLYADKYGAEVLSVRIGHILPAPATPKDLAIWLSPRDFCQIIRIGLETSGLRHEIIYGASDNKRSWWDNANATRLGYRPEDHSEDHAAAILAKGDGMTGDPRRDLTQGGAFCVVESHLPSLSGEPVIVD